MIAINLGLKIGKYLTLLIVLLMSLSSFKTLAQTISKKLPEPKFYVLGIKQSGFPKYDGNWDDSTSVKKYGLVVESWINSHEAEKNKLIQQKQSKVSIDYTFFKTLNEDEKTKFKNVSKQIGYALEPQKKQLIKEFNLLNPIVKGGKKNFYNDAEQVYFMHEDDVLFLKKKIRN